jgi:hypothetical protein
MKIENVAASLKPEKTRAARKRQNSLSPIGREGESERTP